MHNTCDLIKFATYFWLLWANFNFCTIGSSMSVDHEGAVYSERCYGKKTTFSMCFFGLFWSILMCGRDGNFIKSLQKEELWDFLLYIILFGSKSGGDKINIFWNLIKIVILFQHIWYKTFQRTVGYRPVDKLNFWSWNVHP